MSLTNIVILTGRRRFGEDDLAPFRSPDGLWDGHASRMRRVRFRARCAL